MREDEDETQMHVYSPWDKLIVTAGIHTQKLVDHYKTVVPVSGVQFDWIPLQYGNIEVSTGRQLEPPLLTAKSEIVLPFKWYNA